MIQWSRNIVRLTHLPTGIIVTADCERSQRQNRDRALHRLKSILAAQEQGIEPTQAIVYSYTLHDKEYPNELDEYKRKIL